MKTISDKKTLRQIALKKRALLINDALNKSVVNNIITSYDFIEAKNIALYLPIKNEIDITEILKIKDKNYYLPRCNGLNLEFCLYRDDENLKTGKFNILEPLGQKINPKILDIIYIPALMANKKAFRLGYGKGYYDRFFSNNNLKAKKIIIVPQELICEEFVEDEFDVAADLIISEKIYK